MAINMDYFLDRVYKEIQIDDVVYTEKLYEIVADYRLRYIFAVLHQEFNRLIDFMYMKTNFHFNAEESRELIYYIKTYEKVKNNLRDTWNAFEMDKDYDEFIKSCKSFLVMSGGSAIPEDLEKIELKEYEPIFHFVDHAKVKNIKNVVNYPIKLIGEGSYAKVYKFYDEFYNQQIIKKRANSDLTEKELIRFKKEFTVMKNLKSPYILKVYNYDEENNEYYAEFVDMTLFDYIQKNNKKLSLKERGNIVMQILRGFNYIYSKDILHRDISVTNILVKLYEDTVVIKISDFGLVKEKDSNLTSLDSEIKGSLNDESNLKVVGFANYNILHETFALTRLILFVLTGKTNLEKVSNPFINAFVLKGTSGVLQDRFKSIEELMNAFNELYSKLNSNI